MTRRSYDLGDRLLEFAVSIGHIVKRLPGDRVGSHVAGQLLRSGTSPAAHYAEACGAESRRDFIHKLRIALKELRESRFWLRFAQRMVIGRVSDLEESIRECNELTAIIVKSIQTAGSRSERL